VFKGNSQLFAAALLLALAGSVVGPNPALAAAPRHHDQQPGFYRLKVGDLEVTALFDGYRRIRSALAERNEGDDGWCCQGTARRSAHAGCC